MTEPAEIEPTEEQFAIQAGYIQEYITALRERIAELETAAEVPAATPTGAPTRIRYGDSGEPRASVPVTGRTRVRFVLDADEPGADAAPKYLETRLVAPVPVVRDAARTRWEIELSGSDPLTLRSEAANIVRITVG